MAQARDEEMKARLDAIERKQLQRDMQQAALEEARARKVAEAQYQLQVSRALIDVDQCSAVQCGRDGA